MRQRTWCCVCEHRTGGIGVPHPRIARPLEKDDPVKANPRRLVVRYMAIWCRNETDCRGYLFLKRSNGASIPRILHRRVVSPGFSPHPAQILSLCVLAKKTNSPEGHCCRSAGCPVPRSNVDRTTPRSPPSDNRPRRSMSSRP